MGRSWRCEAAVGPRAVYGKRKNAQRLICVNEAALAAGLDVGVALSDACARVPELLYEEEIPKADSALLEALADWCDRYTPLVAFAGDDCLMLDVTGCAHLFDGEEALQNDCLHRLKLQGFTVSAALADTVGGAWAVARAGGAVVPSGGLHAALEALPLAHLRLESGVVTALEQVGLKLIGDLMDRPRAPLARRFGPELVRRLDQAMGMEQEPISPRLYTPPLVVERRFFEPIARDDDVEATLLALAQSLKGQLEKRCEGGRIFEFVLFRVDGVVSRLSVGTSHAIREPHQILRLFREKLKSAKDEMDAGFGYDLLRLAAVETQSYDASQHDFDGNAGQGEALAALVDRLGARLGVSRVSSFLPCNKHLPEEAFALVPAATVRDEALYWDETALTHPDPCAVRPLRLLPRPEPVETVAMVPEGSPLRFRWRKALFEVVRCEGPERICPPWWFGGAEPRDYYRVEDMEGRRFWLYREGLYDTQGVTPCWFLQGLFG
nr:DNA polymerase Y family protein [Pseudovibrio flavus]